MTFHKLLNHKKILVAVNRCCKATQVDWRFYLLTLTVLILYRTLPANAEIQMNLRPDFLPDSLQRAQYLVANDQLVVVINNAGEISEVRDKISGETFALNGSTRINGLYAREVNVVEKDNGGIEMRQVMYDSMGDRSCTIVQTMVPTQNSIRVNVRVSGHVYDWSSAIITHFDWPENRQSKFWTAWGKNKVAGGRFLNLDGDQIMHDIPWNDPLIPQPFEDLVLHYGSKKVFRFSRGFCLPLATVIQPDKNRSFNIALSPEDTLINLSLKTTQKGEIIFSRHNHRISPERPVSFSYDIFMEEAGWRPVLGWMTERYPDYFLPKLEKTHEVAGSASYSGYNGDIDINKMKHIAYGFNWYASRSWPYLGMFLPPVADDETWMSWTGFGSGTATTGKLTSFKSINDDYKLMHQRGFHMLAYFNLNEFGYQINFPYDSGFIGQKDEPLWQESNNLLHQKLKPAMLFTKDNRARFSWNKSVVMDPGHPVYHKYLLEQAQRHLDKVPEFDGICIDRLDWFEWFNYRRDDGLSMVNGRNVSAMAMSLHKIMKPLSDLLHAHDKVIFYNPHITRLDYAQYFDGIFDEFADTGDKINFTSLLALKKPIVGWIHSEDVIKQNPDLIIQKFLYLGVYPMAPYPEANHSLEASAWADSVYADYGLMFQALKGKEWILKANVVSVENSHAKVNIFKTHDGIIVPVMMGGDSNEVTVNLHSINGFFPKQRYACYVVHPGSKKWTKVKFNRKSDKLTLKVPLIRGSAMLLFKAI